jgi:glycogen operon protein
MLNMGDEVRRTQHGNNNAYCQDSAISWFDWDLLERHGDMRRFVKALNAFRHSRADVKEASGLSLQELLARAKLQWHGVRLHEPDWHDSSHTLAFTFESRRGRLRMHGLLNAYWQPLPFALPACPVGHSWRRCIDTARASPDDICPVGQAPIVASDDFVAQPRSVVVLVQTAAEDR